MNGDRSTSLKRVQSRAQLPGQQLRGSAGATQIKTGKLARALVMLGELSSARQVLESGYLAPGNLSTLRGLTNPEKRPVAAFQSDENKLALDIRTARRGAAPGPSGMTSEHLFPLLESEDDMGAFAQFAGILARGDIPPLALEVIRRGRMSVLRKASGGGVEAL